jgi:hypothetical protein
MTQRTSHSNGILIISVEIEMKQTSKLMFIMLLFLFAGCAHNNNVWVKPGASTNEFNVDKYDCLQQSQQKSSGAFVNQYGGFANSGSITNVGLFNSCMNAKGWSLQNRIDKNSAEFKQKESNYIDTMNKFAEKTKAICAKPEYAALMVKTSCLDKDMTFEQIADNTKITPEQKPIFIKYQTEVDAFRKEQREYLHTLTDHGDIQWVDYLDSTQSEIDKYNLDLFNGVITWGEYNQRRKDLNTKKMSEWRNIFHPKH